MANFHRCKYVLCVLVSCLLLSVAHSQDRVTTLAVRVRHVFIIVFENKNFEDTFITSKQDPYLRETLLTQGVLLTQYYGTGHASLDNYISLLSGQSPTPDTANDCVPNPTASAGNFNDVKETGVTSDGQVIADSGCVYGNHVKTLPDQLTSAGLQWKGYMEDMGNDPMRESITCGHPPLGVATDLTNSAEPPSYAVPLGDAYTTRHNPFMYFHSVIDSASCKARVVNLARLSSDLRYKSTTPNLVFITPNLCHDGHDGDGTGTAGKTCANGEPGGLTSADSFLRVWVPRIMRSPAYKADGLLIITFDEGNYAFSESKNADTGQSVLDVTFEGEACCDQRPGPNLRGIRPGTRTLLSTPERMTRLVVRGYGGDRVGALLLSPFVRAGSASSSPYNHYSLLRSLEDIFGLHEHLGYAADNPSEGYYVQALWNDQGVFKSRVKH